MKVAACICAYNEGRNIKACLKQIPPWVEKILLLASDKPWNGSNAESRHETWEFAREVGDNRLEIIKLDWKDEATQRNWGLGRLYEFDWVLILDADEFYTPKDWEILRKTLSTATASSINCQFETYWKDIEHILYPKVSHRAIVAVRPGISTFIDKRSVEGVSALADILCHHLSWVRSDDEVWQKIANWSHANDFDRMKWFREVWLKWHEGMLNLHPYNKTEPVTAVRSSLPDSIKLYFH